MSARRTSPAAAPLAHALLLSTSVLILAPLAWLLVSSFKTNEDFFSWIFLPMSDSGVAWGRLTFRHFARLFGDLGFGRAMLNSVFLSSATAIVATLSCAMGGFALARYAFRGKTLITLLVLSVLIVPAALLLAPTYQVLYRIGLLDSFAAVILPAAAPAFGIFLFRQASLGAVPVQLMEAARIDGASELRLFFSIALPLLRPMVGTFLLITFLGTWNNFLMPQVVLQQPDKFPLATAIAQLRGVYYQDYGLLMAGTLVSVIPVLALFLMMQREFISGLTAGAVKG